MIRSVFKKKKLTENAFIVKRLTENLLKLISLMQWNYLNNFFVKLWKIYQQIITIIIKNI